MITLNIIRQLFIAILFALSIGCENSKKSARFVSLDKAKILYACLCEYSRQQELPPANIYLLPVKAMNVGDKSLSISDLRYSLEDCKVESDFLYFRPLVNILKIDPKQIILAAPSPTILDNKRLVVWSTSEAEYIGEGEFQRIMKSLKPE
jgi:hypothetical protein